MTDIIISFDTENFTSNEAADAIYAEAEILRTEGIRGCFCMVGLLAKQLEFWEREDVLQALAYHEVDYHSYGHSLHPMINEYTDIEDFQVAREEFLRQEIKGIEYVKKATGAEKIYAAVPPGNQKSYVAMYGYAELGIPIYADTFCDTPDGCGTYYCNGFHMDYSWCMETALFEGGEKEIKSVLDVLACNKRAIIYTHPHVALMTESWDILNYDKENLCEFGKWKESKRREGAETERFYENLRLLCKLIKADDRFRITTYSEIANELAKEGERIVKRMDVPYLRNQLQKSFFPVTKPCSLSLADMMLACRQMLLGEDEHKCSAVYGFLEKPFGIKEKIILRAEDIRNSTSQIVPGEFLPTTIKTGGYIIGPGDWLRGALAVLSGVEEVELVPGPQLPELDILPKVRNCSFKGTWRHSDSFEDKYLSERLRLQSWTMRFLAVEDY